MHSKQKTPILSHFLLSHNSRVLIKFLFFQSSDFRIHYRIQYPDVCGIGCACDALDIKGLFQQRN